MPEVIGMTLLSATGITGTPTESWSRSGGDNSGTFYKVDVRNTSSMSLFAKAGTGGTGLTFTVEVTTDPLGVDGWAAAAVRAPGGGAYSAAATALATGGAGTRFFDPTDNVCWVRLNVTVNDTTGPVVKLITEV